MLLWIYILKIDDFIELIKKITNDNKPPSTNKDYPIYMLYP